MARLQRKCLQITEVHKSKALILAQIMIISFFPHQHFLLSIATRYITSMGTQLEGILQDGCQPFSNNQSSAEYAKSLMTTLPFHYNRSKKVCLITAQ